MSEKPKNPFDHNEPNQVSAICDAIDKKVRIVQCIQACNEERLIESCMLQLYDKVDVIVVIEGAVKNKVEAGQATPDGHSLDRTVDIIKEVIAKKDPQKKIIFVQIDRPWNDLEELKATFFQYMQDGDWMLITDADEFIMPSVIDKMREAISLEPFATEMIPAGFYHFWRDAWHMRKPSGDWGQQHQRFIKFQPGLHYENHPVARDANNVCTYFDPRYLARRFVLPEFVVYHYSYCKDDEADIQKKKDFYAKELGQSKHGDIGAYARGGQTDEYLNQSEDLDTVLVFDGEHPPAMAQSPMVQRRDAFLADKELANFKTAEPYSLKNIPTCWIHAVEARNGNPRYRGWERLYQTVDV